MLNRRILMIAFQEIISDNSDGGKKGSKRNYDMLKDIFGCDNIYLAMMTNEESYEKNIYRLKKGNKISKFFNLLAGRLHSNKKIENKIIDIIHKNNITTVFLDGSRYGEIAVRIKKEFSDIEIWTFCHNFEKNYFYNKINNKIIASFVRTIAENSEKKCVKNSNKIFTLTKRDAYLIENEYSVKISSILPTSFVDRFDESKIKKEQYSNKLLFIGSLFSANYDSIKWFCKNVMTSLNSFNLEIVGKNFETRKKYLENISNNIKVIGSVNDLDQYYYENSVVILPILYGAGQKVKTAEAMMYGKIILASDEALEGYDINGTYGIFRCNTEKEYINILHTISNENIENLMLMQKNVRNKFLKNYEYNVIKKKLKDAIERQQ